jgi:DNA polymerase-1
MRFLIIDSNALLHRAFHALPPLQDKEGRQTGAVYGFLLTLFRAIKDISPNYIAATFDTPSPTFRHKKFKEYKAKREKAPDEFYQQIPIIKEVLEALNIPIFEKPGFEADDIIATIAKKIQKEQIYPEIETYIVTGDQDTLQLVDKNTKVYTLGKGIKETVILDKEKVVEKYGILPEQMVDFKALAGDPSDNIPGATGIGKKTASEILKKFGSLDNLYKKIEDKNFKDINPRIKKILLEQKEQILFSQILAKARDDAPIDFKITNCSFGSFDIKKVEEIFEKYSFYSLKKRLKEIIKNSDNKNEEKSNDFSKAFKDGKLF